MSISRSPKNLQNLYTKASNSFIYDCRLSLKSKALLLFVLSKPDTWIFNFRDVLRFNSDGIKSVRNSIKELSSLGYLIVYQSHKPNGDFDYSQYIFFETSENLNTIKTVTPAHSPFGHALKAHALKAHALDGHTSNNKNKKLLREETAAASTKVVNTKAAAKSSNFLKKETECLELLSSLKITNPKNIVAIFGFDYTFKTALWMKSRNLKLRNPAGWLRDALRGHWIYEKPENEKPPLLIFSHICNICDKYFSYEDYKKTRTTCPKCEKKGK